MCTCTSFSRRLVGVVLGLRQCVDMKVKRLVVTLCLHAMFESVKPVRNYLERWFKETDF